MACQKDKTSVTASAEWTGPAAERRAATSPSRRRRTLLLIASSAALLIQSRATAAVAALSGSPLAVLVREASVPSRNLSQELSRHIERFGERTELAGLELSPEEQRCTAADCLHELIGRQRLGRLLLIDVQDNGERQYFVSARFVQEHTAEVPLAESGCDACTEREVLNLASRLSAKLLTPPPSAAETPAAPPVTMQPVVAPPTGETLLTAPVVPAVLPPRYASTRQTKGMAGILGVATGLSITATVTLAAITLARNYQNLCLDDECVSPLTVTLSVGGGLAVLFGVPFGLSLSKLGTEEKLR